MAEISSRPQAARRKAAASRGYRLRGLGSRLRYLGLVLALTGVLAATGALGVKAYTWLDQPIEEIVLVGDYLNFSQQEVARLAQPYLAAGFLSVDLEGLVATIETADWVESAAVSRVWPNRLQIQIVEYQPVMRLSDIGLLSESGQVIRAPARTDYSGLPLVFSEQTEPSLLMTQFRILALALDQADLHIHELHQRASGDWFVRLDNGVGVELGSTDLRQKIQRVIRVWQFELQDMEQRVAYIDARYTHGLVVGWQANASPPSRANS